MRSKEIQRRRKERQTEKKYKRKKGKIVKYR